MTFLTCASAPSGSPPGRPSLRWSSAFCWSVSTSKETATEVTPSTEPAASRTAVSKWLRIGQPGVVSEIMIATAPPSATSIERTMSSSVMGRRSSGSMTTCSAE